jgi:hypothetical protein
LWSSSITSTRMLMDYHASVFAGGRLAAGIAAARTPADATALRIPEAVGRTRSVEVAGWAYRRRMGLPYCSAERSAFLV